MGRGPPCVVVPIAGAAEPGQQGSMKRLPFWFLLPKPCDDEGEGRERGGHGSATDLPHRAGASDRALCLARLRLQYSLQGHCLSGLIAVPALGAGHQVRWPRAHAEEEPKLRYTNL